MPLNNIKTYFLFILIIYTLFACTDKTFNDYIYEGIRYTKAKKYDNAIESFKNAIKIDPENALVHYYLGGIYTYKNMTIMAISEYKQAIELDPGYSDPHYSLGFIYEKLGRKKEAKQEYSLFELLRN